MSERNQNDLSDALQSLADEESEPRRQRPAEPRANPVDSSATAEASTETTEEADALGDTSLAEDLLNQSYSARPRKQPTKSNGSLESVAAPVLTTVGLLMMIPAIWGTLLLMGVGVWRSDAPNAEGVATLMLVCYPLGGLLILAGGFYLWRHMQSSSSSK